MARHQRLEPDLAAIEQAYRSERERRLAWQQQQDDAARARVRARDGFATLSGDQSHQVLRPIKLAETDTTAEAIAPGLEALQTDFLRDLAEAEESANDLLDEILSQGQQPVIVKVDLSLRNREITTTEEVETLLDEIRKRLLEQVEAGVRVRLL